MLSIKKAPTLARHRGTSAGANPRRQGNSTLFPARWEAVPGVFSLTSGRSAGMVPREAENLQQKARRSLDPGIFYCVHAPEKHGAFTAIQGRVWANTIPFGGICPPFCCGFRYPAFFASCVRPKNEKTTEVPFHD